MAEGLSKTAPDISIKSEGEISLRISALVLAERILREEGIVSPSSVVLRRLHVRAQELAGNSQFREEIIRKNESVVQYQSSKSFILDALWKILTKHQRDHIVALLEARGETVSIRTLM
jgi:hypothetical protein